MQFVIILDENGMKILERFMSAEPYWKTFMADLAIELAENAREHIKPFTQAIAQWNGSTHGTGALSQSIQDTVTLNGDGFEITFDGLFYGNYMDVGNFPAGSTIRRANGKPFTVGARTSSSPEDITWSWEIHGMGYRTPGVPTHFSEKTALWLAVNMHDFTDEHVNTFLRELVGL